MAFQSYTMTKTDHSSSGALTSDGTNKILLDKQPKETKDGEATYDMMTGESIGECPIPSKDSHISEYNDDKLDSAEITGHFWWRNLSSRAIATNRLQAAIFVDFVDMKRSRRIKDPVDTSRNNRSKLNASSTDDCLTRMMLEVAESIRMDQRNSIASGDSLVSSVETIQTSAYLERQLDMSLCPIELERPQYWQPASTLTRSRPRASQSTNIQVFGPDELQLPVEDESECESSSGSDLFDYSGNRGERSAIGPFTTEIDESELDLTNNSMTLTPDTSMQTSADLSLGNSPLRTTNHEDDLSDLPSLEFSAEGTASTPDDDSEPLSYIAELDSLDFQGNFLSDISISSSLTSDPRASVAKKLDGQVDPHIVESRREHQQSPWQFALAEPTDASSDFMMNEAKEDLIVFANFFEPPTPGDTKEQFPSRATMDIIESLQASIAENGSHPGTANNECDMSLSESGSGNTAHDPTLHDYANALGVSVSNLMSPFAGACPEDVVSCLSLLAELSRENWTACISENDAHGGQEPVMLVYRDLNIEDNSTFESGMVQQDPIVDLITACDDDAKKWAHALKMRSSKTLLAHESDVHKVWNAARLPAISRPAKSIMKKSPPARYPVPVVDEPKFSLKHTQLRSAVRRASSSSLDDLALRKSSFDCDDSQISVDSKPTTPTEDAALSSAALQGFNPAKLSRSSSVIVADLLATANYMTQRSESSIPSNESNEPVMIHCGTPVRDTGDSPMALTSASRSIEPVDSSPIFVSKLQNAAIESVAEQQFKTSSFGSDETVINIHPKFAWRFARDSVSPEPSSVVDIPAPMLSTDLKEVSEDSHAKLENLNTGIFTVRFLSTRDEKRDKPPRYSTVMEVLQKETGDLRPKLEYHKPVIGKCIDGSIAGTPNRTLRESLHEPSCVSVGHPFSPVALPICGSTPDQSLGRSEISPFTKFPMPMPVKNKPVQVEPTSIRVGKSKTTSAAQTVSPVSGSRRRFKIPSPFSSPISRLKEYRNEHDVVARPPNTATLSSRWFNSLRSPITRPSTSQSNISSRLRQPSPFDASPQKKPISLHLSPEKPNKSWFNSLGFRSRSKRPGSITSQIKKFMDNGDVLDVERDESFNRRWFDKQNQLPKLSSRH